MKRTRAKALTLVNWRGVFYMSYALDRAVTAFEGQNGAGKTTVMIAAYVVLLPDMTRLRFTNLGETSATGGDRGIWGRLGEPGRPSYALLDLELADGARMIAGVMLERRTEPTVEPTAFVVHGLSPDVVLSDLFLEKLGPDKDEEAVPDLDVIRTQVAAKGGKLKVFPSAKDYFAELFDRGVLPLRMQVDEERGKLNEMLRTSMVGGISRALTGGMREFLLREETGLAEILRRMRGNLEACRRTRREVEEARRLEAEIHGVWKVGQDMFASVVHATRSEAEERKVALEAARKKAEESAALRTQLEGDLAEKRRRADEIVARRTEVKALVQEATARVERAKRAWDVMRKVARLERELAAQGNDRAQKERADADAQAARETARVAWDRAREALGAAGRGVADLKAGLEELERRAAEHRLAHERLQQVHAALPDEALDANALTGTSGSGRLAEVAGRVETRLHALDEELVKNDRLLATASVLRTEYDKALTALERLSGLPVLSSQAHERAREVLAELRHLDGEVLAKVELDKRLDATQRGQKKQAEARREARQAGALGSAAEVARALEETELAEAHADEAQRRAREAADEAARRGKDEARIVSELEPVVMRRGAALAKLGALGERFPELGGIAPTAAAIVTAKRTLEGRRDKLRSERERKSQERATAESELGRLEIATHAIDERLLRARDAVDGELLAERFEELPFDVAGMAEAVLGPLGQAIAVADPVAAARKLAKVADRPDEVWLAGPDTALPLDDDGTPYAERIEDAVLMEDQGVVRLTRIPMAPRLGRLARERRRGEVREGLAALGRELEAMGDEDRRLSAGMAELDELRAEASVLDRKDPEGELEAARQRIAAANAARQAALGELQRAGQEMEALRRRKTLLRKLLPEAHWLDAPDQEAEAKALGERLQAARAAEARLRAAAPDRRILENGLDVLRAAPPSEAEVTAIKQKRETSVRMRDRLQSALEKLRWLGDHRVALGWTDAEPVLAAREALRPALEAQLRQAEEQAKAAETEVRQSENRARATAEAAARAAGVVLSGEQQLDALKRELAETVEAGPEAAGAAPGTAKRAGSDPSRAALRAEPGPRQVELAEQRLAEVESEQDALEQEERDARAQAVRGEERYRQVVERASEEGWRLAEEERAFAPAQSRWARLREEAQARGVLAAAFSPEIRSECEGVPARELWSRARSRAALLAERVARAKDGVEVATGLRAHLDRVGEHPGAVEAWLAEWLSAREWLMRRVPPQIAEVDDPLEALGRLRDHLAGLEERLEVQEKSLRGQSGDVARNIDAQLRRARNQVGRLNADLDGVRFGAIEGMQVRARPAQRMEAVLRALREGAAQQLLFEPNLPIEEAMDELFKRYGGGRSGGDRLLDYREYLDLQVEIRRRGAERQPGSGKSAPAEHWEVANPTRLSTGEAIGVGAAVMMATLKAWEGEATLLRPRQHSGTLRLLFLDEATRLSQDNLGILFELCERLELQLMIAAPEVARAEGNTTYRLIRALDAEGREEVRVSGRRVMAGEGREAATAGPIMARPAEA